MANNQYVNKVVFGSATLVDLTGTTATADKILEGYGAFGADGAWMDGTAIQGGTAAIAVEDTTDSHGGIIREITALDISDTTATASDVATGKYFYTANGTKTAGTAIPGGTPTLETIAKTYTPSESQQTETITPGSGYDGIGEVDVTVNAISSTYVGSGITRRSSSDLTASGATVSVPSGYYASNASKAVASGTAGTPTATKGTVSNHSISVTPSVTNTTGYITGGTKTGTAVSVSASELVSGSETKTQNGTYDVTNLAELVVNVSGSSSKNIQAYMGRASRTANSYGATSVTLTVAKTGTYNVSWCAWRSSSSGTMGTNLHVNNTSGTNQQSFTNTYGQCITLTNQSYNQGDVLTLYATSGSSNRTINVANLIIEEQ